MGRRHIGHVGRYRQTGACEAFKAAAPRRHRRNAKTNLDHRVKGESYKVEVYEEGVGLAFRHVAVSSTLRASTVAAATRPGAGRGDVLADARIKRECEQAALRFVKDRDLVGSRRRWRGSTPRLRLPSSARRASRPPPRRGRTWSRWPELWAKTSDAGRRAIAEAVFERIDVLV